MFKKCGALTMVIGLAVAPRAWAQGEVDMTGGDSKTEAASSTPVAVPGVNSSGAPFTKGTLGLSLPVVLVTNLTSIVSVTGENVPSLDLVYFTSEKAAVDLIFGANIHHQVQYDMATPPNRKTVTNIGFAAGVGYRMYKHRNKVATYIEPRAVLDWPNTNDAAALTMRAEGLFGVEAMLADWCSLSGAVGAGLAFGNKFDDIQLASTANLAANLYWK